MAEIEIRQNVPLAQFTSFGIGGPARFFTEAESVDSLRTALDHARREGLRVFVLGGGSNLLVSDEGFDGLVIRVGLRGVDMAAMGDAVTIRAAAGEEWDGFVKYAVDHDLAGIECLSGIPGMVGATPIQNVGAYGQDVSETVTIVEVLDRRSGELRELTAKECEFGYRYSFFKNVDPERYVVTRVTYVLARGGMPTLKYPELRTHLEEQLDGRVATLPDVRASVIAIRKRKGMVIDPADPDSCSAGSFFMNPVLSKEAFEEFRSRVESAAVLGQGEEPPAYPTPDGKIKTSAAWLIERAGFSKGFGDGRAGLSSKHTLAIVNRGGASAADVVALVETIQQRVRERFGVELHPEPNFIGFRE